jgi:hypothetical protein
MHTFSILDLGASEPRDVMLISGLVTISPVTTVSTIDTADGKVGYIVFNDHNLPASGQLVTAISQLKAAHVTDLILDLRYNGGGYLFIASELAYMIAGPAATSGKIFERLTYSDKRTADTNSPGSTYPFFATHRGYPGTGTIADAPLPSLNLSRVFVITSSEPRRPAKRSSTACRASGSR